MSESGLCCCGACVVVRKHFVRTCVCVCLLTNLARAILWVVSVPWLWRGSVFVGGTAVWLDVFIAPQIAKTEGSVRVFDLF